MWNTNKKIVICYAATDAAAYGAFLKEQYRQNKTDFELYDFMVSQPINTYWKEVCHDMIVDCDGLLVILTPGMLHAEDVQWKLAYAAALQKPMLGILTGPDGVSQLPDEMSGQPVIAWKWHDIVEFVAAIGAEKTEPVRKRA